MTDADILSEAKEAFEKAQDCESENRADALEDIRFARLDEHWPAEIRKQRELEGRPCLTIPMLPPVIRQVVNDARQNKPSITVHPVDSASDPETAEVLNGLIRQIEQSSDAEVAYDTAIESAVSGGFGYFRINTRYTHDDSFEQDICIERVPNPFSIFGDPCSTAADSSDWNVAFELESMSTDQFEARWPKAEPTSFTDVGLAGDYHAKTSDHVVVASYWTREEAERKIVALSDGSVVDLDVFKEHKDLYDALGVTVIGSPRSVPTHKVSQKLLSGGDVLETVPWAGKFIPIVPVYGEEVNVEGKRYFRSLVRPAKDAQRMFNYWRTTSTELVALAPKAPFIGRKGAFETDAAKWATANLESHSHLEYDGPEAPQRQPFVGVPAGALQEALNASDDVKRITGIYDASLGARSNETSGVAIRARQMEGDVSTFHYIDNLSRAIRHAGRIIVDLIPKVYSTPRILRVLGPQGEQTQIKTGSPGDMEQTMEQMQGVERVFDLTAGKYDVTVQAGPSYTSRREEAASQMIELIRAYPLAAPVLGDLLAKNLDWPGADEVAERLQRLLPPQIQQADDGGAQQAQAALAQSQQQIQMLQSQLQNLQLQNQQLKDKSDIEAGKLQVTAYDAETKRMALKSPTLPAGSYEAG